MASILGKNILDLHADYKVNADVPVPAQKSNSTSHFLRRIGSHERRACVVSVLKIFSCPPAKRPLKLSFSNRSRSSLNFIYMDKNIRNKPEYHCIGLLPLLDSQLQSCPRMKHLLVRIFASLCQAVGRERQTTA